jgi:hypothetical protein
LNRVAGLVRKTIRRLQQTEKLPVALRWALPGVVVMVVVMVVMASGKGGWAGEYHQKQNCSENLFHGRHPSRIDLVTEAP